MRRLIIGKNMVMAIMLVASMISFGVAANPIGHNYYEMLENLKGGSKSNDFKALRMAYAKTNDYRPYGSDEKAKDAAFVALNNKDFTEAVRQAGNALTKNYVDPDAHLISMIAYREIGNLEKSSFHNKVLKGLVGSIYSSGDGKSPESAFIVISVAEEYFLLKSNRLQKLKSSLISLNDRHYDKIEVQDKRNGEKSVIYFDISIPYRWLNQSLKPRQ